MRYDWNYMHSHDSWWWVFMLLIMALVIIGVIWVVKYLSYTSSREKEATLAMLKKRLAAGEIDKREFEEKRKLIED